MGHFHTFTEARAPINLTADEMAELVAGDARHDLRLEIAAFADTLDETDELYWPALNAADGCEASLAELNAMLESEDCLPFTVAHQQVTAGMGA